MTTQEITRLTRNELEIACYALGFRAVAEDTDADLAAWLTAHDTSEL